MKRISFPRLLLLSLAIFASTLQALWADFPSGPNEQTTPGTLCERSSEYRYPEKIKYCKRNVSSATKKQVIAIYENKLGFEINKFGRENFKIDHLIPLCAGGSNNASNLWPQHKSVYAITDPLEEPLCRKMQEGKLRQSDAIALIIEAKLNLDRADDILDQIQAL